MNQLEAREKLNDYLNGTLPPTERTAFEQALEQNPDLREQVERWRQVHRSAHLLVTEARVPTALEGTLRQSLASLRTRQRRRVIALFTAVSGIAATIVLAFTAARSERVQGWFGVHPSTPPVELAAASFANVYYHCALNHKHTTNCAGKSPTEIQSDYAARESFKIVVPDLRTAGYLLDGSCQCFDDDSVRVVAVHYRREKVAPEEVTFFSVNQHFSIPNAKAVPGAHFQQINYEQASVDKLSILTWDRRGGHFAICGEASSAELESLANSVTLTEMRVEPAALTLAVISGSPAGR